MTDDNAETPAEKLRTLQAQYLIHLSEKAKALEVCRHSTLGGALSGQTLQTLRDLAHQLAGGGSIYGYPSITDAAQNLERFLDEWGGGHASEISYKLDALYAACLAAIESGPAVDRVLPDSSCCAQGREKRPLVAVIDDDPMLRLVYKTLLEDSVDLAIGTNTNEARDIMEKQKPALVLLDDIMPGGATGLSFIESIKDDPALSRIPIIMVTASNKKEDVLRGLAAGAIDYIIKPFMPDDLIRAVQNGLTRKENKIILLLKDHHLSDALIDRMEPLNCRIIDADRTCKTLKNCLTHEPCVVVLDHFPQTQSDLLELAEAYQDCYFVTIGEALAAPFSVIDAARHIHMHDHARPEEIIYNMSHMIGTIKKGKNPR